MGRWTKGATIALGVAVALGLSVPAAAADKPPMYGFIAHILIKPGQRDAFVAALLEDLAPMPGELNFVIARDTANPDAVWITEVWQSKAMHDVAMTLPVVAKKMAKAGPMIASMVSRIETEPVGGFDLPD